MAVRMWAIVGLLAVAGCRGTSGPQGMPRDPLFLYHNPIPGKSSRAEPARVATLEPAPPPVPVEVTNRPAYARRPATKTPDHVQLTGFREVETSQPTPPRAAPGTLTNRPLSEAVPLPESSRP